MLSYFPTPFEDELFYSISARYQHYLGHLGTKTIIRQIFGSCSASAVFDFPSRLQTFHDQLSQGSLLTPERMISEHSLFPLFRPFITNAQAEKAEIQMLSRQKGGGVHMSLGIMASGIPVLKRLRFCQECVDADRDEQGEPYWHRSHQCPGVKICHKHHVPLWESQVEVSSAKDKHLFRSLIANCHSGTVFHLQTSDLKHHAWLAEKVYWLMNYNLEPLGLEALYHHYKCLLDTKGLATASGRVRQAKLHEKFQAFYGESFLGEVHSSLGGEAEYCWLAVLTRKPRRAMHPIRHLLLMRFLETFPDEVIKAPQFWAVPFGDPPFPCLNFAAKHYGKDVIPRVVLSRNTCSGAPVGNFYCRCGFAYARTGPDGSVADRMRRSRIIALGPVWEKELLRLAQDPTVTLRQKARWLGVDTKTIKSHLQRLTTAGISAYSKGKKDVDHSARQGLLLETIKDHPRLNRTEIRHMVPATYAWLYRHDRKWLMKNLPRRRRRKKPAGRVDWKERDRLIQQSAKLAIQEILDETEKPKRITLSRIGRMTGSLPLLEKHLDKLPKTRRLILKSRETVEDFQVRRLRIVTKKMRDEYEPLDRWRIVRRAGLKPEMSARVEEEIAKLAGL